jgi:hypothetical protein
MEASLQLIATRDIAGYDAQLGRYEGKRIYPFLVDSCPANLLPEEG